MTLLVILILLLLIVSFSSSSVDTARFQEFHKSFKRPFSIVVDDLVLSLLDEFDGGESLDLDVLQLVGSGIHLGNDNGLMGLVLLPQFVPDRSELLAVAAPGRVELHQDVLARVSGNSVEVLTNQHLDGFLVPVLGHLLGHEVGLQFSFEVGGHEGPDVSVRNLSGFGSVFGHILLQVDDSHRGELSLLHPEELHNPLVILLVSVDCHEQEPRPLPPSPPASPSSGVTSLRVYLPTAFFDLNLKFQG